MKKNRDDFREPVKTTLAKRAGYLCSNPNCKRLTIGANQIDNKTTSIGIAAHITAASPGGARYNSTLTPEERASLVNAIWLCNNCATLIDKDPLRYPVKTLETWKKAIEKETVEKLSGNFKEAFPHLEIDLIFTNRSRLNKGYSRKNPIVIENGREIIDARNKPLIIWELIWKFKLIITNNSSFPAYNLSLNNVGSIYFTRLESLPKINNIAPLQPITLAGEYKYIIECTHDIADEILRSNIPKKFEKMILKLDYLDEKRNSHTTIVEFSGNTIMNQKI